MEKTEVKIDRSTLPKDGQWVKFETSKEDGLIGQFIEGDDLFVINASRWKTSWEVYQWEPYEKENQIIK